MKTLLLVAALFASVATSASAGQVEDWSRFTIATDNLVCIADFDTSDAAYRACRKPFLTKDYVKVAEEQNCDSVNSWARYRKRLDDKIPNDQYLRLKDEGNDIIGFTEIISWGNGASFRSGNVAKPTPEKLATCNFTSWSNTVLTKELHVLHKVTSARASN